MGSLKQNVFKNYCARDELNETLNNNERKTTTMKQLEDRVHSLKHNERVIRRNSNVFASFSTRDVSEKQEHDEALNSARKELQMTRTELATRDTEYREKCEEMRSMNLHVQKMVLQFKKQLAEKDAQIGELNETVVDLKGQIRVAVRIREFDKVEGVTFDILRQNDIKFEQTGQSNQQKLYHFEHVFKPNMPQSSIFSEIQELILCALHGRNVCLIAYGPTGSGKTFTMRGEGEDLEGVIPRAIRFLMKQSTGDRAAIGWQYAFSASHIEVYNEDVFDLLDNRKKLDVKISGSSTSMLGVRKLPIKSNKDVDVLLSLADSHRSTASTACNQHSSRSHALFQVYVDGTHSSTGETIECCLNLVDLAGSERVKESGAAGKQFSELTNINQSLSTLKKCIRAQMTKSPHVPYRESKLTVLLREFLGAGSSKTMFIAHINPKDVAETKLTLQFTADLRSTNIGKATVQKTQKM